MKSIHNKKINTFLGLSIKFFPVLMILGPLFLNLFSLIFSLYALINFKFLENSKILNKKIVIILFSFMFLIFPYESLDFKNSFFKYLSFFRFIFMILGIIIFLEFSKNSVFENIYKYYIFFLIIIILDVLLEFFTGFNSLGFSSKYEGRIASFTNEELIIGFIFCFTALFTLFFIYRKINSYFFFLSTICLVCISFIIGERSNFLKFFIIINLFYFFYVFILNKICFKTIFVTIISILIIFTSFLTIFKNTSQGAKFLIPFNEIVVIQDNKIDFRIKEEFYQTRHFAHYLTSYKIFLNYPLFGIGINNFFLESSKKKYKIKGYDSASTHPHQLYLEILSEVGLVGSLYLVFIFFYPVYLFLKKFRKLQDNTMYSNFLLHLFFIFPILPSGSFFGTNYGVPFWFNLSILLYFLKKK